MASYITRGSVSGAPVSGVAVSGGDFSPIVNELIATQGADSVAATGTVAIAGAGAVTQGADSVSAVININTLGTASVTQGADTVSSAFTLSTPANLSVTQGADTTASAGTVLISSTITTFSRLVGVSGYAVSSGAVSGEYDQTVSGSVIQGADTISATAAVALTGGAALTQGADTLAATGTVLIAATANLTQGAQSTASAATLTVRRALHARSYGSGPKRLAA